MIHPDQPHDPTERDPRARRTTRDRAAAYLLSLLLHGSILTTVGLSVCVHQPQLPDAALHGLSPAPMQVIRVQAAPPAPREAEPREDLPPPRPELEPEDEGPVERRHYVHTESSDASPQPQPDAALESEHDVRAVAERSGQVAALHAGSLGAVSSASRGGGEPTSQEASEEAAQQPGRPVRDARPSEVPSDGVLAAHEASDRTARPLAPEAPQEAQRELHRGKDPSGVGRPPPPGMPLPTASDGTLTEGSRTRDRPTDLPEAPGRSGLARLEAAPLAPEQPDEGLDATGAPALGGGSPGAVGTATSDPGVQLRALQAALTPPLPDGGRATRALFLEATVLGSDQVHLADAEVEASGISSARATPLGRHLAEVEQEVRERWFTLTLPAASAAFSPQGKVVIELVADRAGRVREIRVAQTSHHGPLDGLAVAAIPTRLPRMPDDVEGTAIRHQFTLSYRSSAAR